MPARDNEAIVRETHEAFNARDLDRAAAYAAEDAEWVTVATEETFHGPEGYKRYMQGWTAAFSDASTEITAVHAGEDFTIVEFIGRGTHDGPMSSPGGVVPPTGRSLETRFCEVLDIRDGKITGARSYFDLAGIMIQPGLMPRRKERRRRVRPRQPSACKIRAVMEPGTHTFLPTSRVRFGAGSLGRLEEEARSFERAFVVTGRTLYEKTDLVRRVEGLLGEKHAGTYVGMSEHTPGSAVEEAARRAGDADLLVSVGGGSVIDGTKAVAVRLGYPFQVAVPTTLSGAEWAHRVGVTDEAKGRKGGFVDKRAVPPVVILAPEATLFTPENLWLSTGIRALDHAVEGFVFGGPHPVEDVTGLEGARRLMELLPRSKAEPEDLEVRGDLQVAAWLSYFGPLNTPMGLSHNLGRRIGASYGVPHGYTSCITLAPTLAVVREEQPEERWRKLSDALGGEPAERVAALVEGLGLPSRLSEVGVPEEDLDAIAAEFGDRAEDAREILRRVV